MASGARWEWRTFGAGAEAGAPAFEGRTPTGTADSDERYLLSAGGTTVKIRDGLMDVKALLAVDANGLQQWRPVLKVAFPIDGEAVRAVWEALRLPAPVARARDLHGGAARGRADAGRAPACVPWRSTSTACAT